VADGEVLLLADPAFVVNDNFSFWRYQEVEALNRDSLGLGPSGTRLRVDGETMSLSHGATTKRKTISIYNQTEKLNKHPGLFLNYLRTLAEDKGYGWSVDELPEGQKPKREAVASAKATLITEAEDLSREDWVRLSDLRKAGKTTTAQNYAIDKRYWKWKLALDELDPKQLKPYLYDDPLEHFLGLVDIANHQAEDTMGSIQFQGASPASPGAGPSPGLEWDPGRAGARSGDPPEQLR
jgi:hypothetical protein